MSPSLIQQFLALESPQQKKTSQVNESVTYIFFLR
jgi:hypothetical protein